ncbi:MAG: formate dehydrogenase accessory sulfurtransferase FdhD [Verrucomicrobiota bacterium]
MGGPFPFDAALLAGGRSSRFGRDKAFVGWRGKPLYEKQLETLRELGPQLVYLAANSEQDFPEMARVRVVTDVQPDLGPIGGLLTVLLQSEANSVLVLGVDLPLMSSGFLQTLFASGKGRVARTEKFWEPLVGFYPREPMLKLIEEAIASGERKLQRVLDRAEEKGIIEMAPVEDSERVLFTNLNSPGDLVKLDSAEPDREIELLRYTTQSGPVQTSDFVAAEEPLEVRVNHQSVAVMMRTPGHDEELAIGFLFTENVIRSAEEIVSIESVEDLDRESIGNVLEVTLESEVDLSDLTRHVFTSSSCGVCGKATIDSVFHDFPPIEKSLELSSEVILGIPETLRSAQETFEKTGGLHASALFSQEGELLLLREDVGRHNALDKVIGYGLREGISFPEVALLVSGRISFELMQKALAAKIPFVAGISAPSSLAVDLANRSGQTLIGFLRRRSFNRYSK